MDRLENNNIDEAVESSGGIPNFNFNCIRMNQNEKVRSIASSPLLDIKKRSSK